MLLAALGAVIIHRAVARPLAGITEITEAVAAGDIARTIPYGERHDEIGALARSIVRAMARARRQLDGVKRLIGGLVDGANGALRGAGMAPLATPTALRS